MSVRAWRETVYEPSYMFVEKDGTWKGEWWSFAIWNVGFDQASIPNEACKVLLYKSNSIYETQEDAKKACNEWLLEQSKRREGQSTSKK